jgi:hypothetical protein
MGHFFGNLERELDKAHVLAPDAPRRLVDELLDPVLLDGVCKFFFLRYFLRWLTVAKKKNLENEKALVSLLENIIGWLGAITIRTA